MLTIAHRGAMGYEPENTLISFQKALDLKVDMLELDVYALKTGEVVVFHDDKLNRLTNGKGYLMHKSFLEIRSLDAGKGQQIPLLEEVLDLVNKKAMINIELKGKETAGPVAKIVRKYIQKKGWREKDFLISSFNYSGLEKFKSLAPNIRIGILFEKIPPNLPRLEEKLQAYSIHPKLKSVNKELVTKAHQKGLKVFVWTVNSPKDIQKMKALGVDGLFSNFPDIC